MIFGIAPSCLVRRLPHLASALLVFLFTGCDTEGYPTELKYPLRTDLIVPAGNTGEEVPFAEPPGHLDESIREFQARVEAKKPKEIVDPAGISSKDRNEIANTLEKCFGTPANPVVKLADESEEDVEAFKQQVQTLKLDAPSLEAGSKLFRRHCLHCHGVPGDGRGPTAPWLHPHPRDYRKAKFKFISTIQANNSKPSRGDLKRIISQGVDSTSMPSFGLLPEKDIENLVSYVIHLSLRGKAEEETMLTVHPDKQSHPKNDSIVAELQEHLTVNLSRWAKIETDAAQSIKPAKQAPSYLEHLDSDEGKAAISEGYKLFTGAQAICATCHKDFGRQSPFRYDIWGTLVQPRNLTAGAYRGGRRPIDLYWRIRAGIDPSTMPAVGEDKVSDEQVWQLIAFVRALPYPSMLPDDVRPKVYPIPLAKKEE